MTLKDAIALRNLLTQAILDASDAGIDEVNLSSKAAALDDAARAELEQAIQEAEARHGD